jgi:L-cysteine:1D-myo-inositol 2-amino-2-deoxy-alpha-D-glucopyranoside ligase
MRLYNTLTQQKEEFTPTQDNVTMYVCGITPYDTTHLGHAFTYVVFDTLARYFQLKGWPVRYAQNVTDIDDDILRKANEVGDDWKALGDRWTRRFIEDVDALNVLRPTYFPRATEEIARIIDMTQVLLDKGYAYEKNGGVYFHVNSCDRFGQLSRIPREEMLPIANERGNVPDDPDKRDPLDFVLWQAAKPGEPTWAPSTLCCGRRPSRASRPGTAPGARAGQVGTSSVRPCRSTIWARPSTSTVGATT